MGFWRGLRWGLILGIIGALVGRSLSGEDNQAQWQQAKVAGNLAAAQAETEQREKFERSRGGGGQSASSR